MQHVALACVYVLHVLSSKWTPCAYTACDKGGNLIDPQPVQPVEPHFTSDKRHTAALHPVVCFYGNGGLEELLGTVRSSSLSALQHCCRGERGRRESVWHTEPVAQSDTSMWCRSQSAALQVEVKD